MHRSTPPYRSCSSPPAAAGASDDGASLLALLESDDNLVLRLVAALATDQFWECIKLDAKPILRASSEGVELDLLEIPVWPEGGRSRGQLLGCGIP